MPDGPDTQLVGLDVPQLDAAGENLIVVEALAMIVDAVALGRHTTFVEAEGGVDGLMVCNGQPQLIRMSTRVTVSAGTLRR